MVTYGEKERFKKLDKIICLVANEHPFGIEYNKLVSLLCFEWGMRKEKIIEYIEVLLGAEKLKLDKNLVMYNGE